MAAKFITLDGIDGAGKTTQLNVIQEWFTAQQLPVVFTREPGSTPLGEQLREIVLNPASKMTPKAETLLMFTARQQHLDDVVFPNLNKGINVVCDRFTDATFAYQGGGRGLPYAQIAALEQWVQGDFQPDFTLILDVPLEVALQRIERSREKDRFEQEPAEFYRAVRETYLQRAASQPQRYAVLNSNREKEVVRQDIFNLLNQLFER
ncbi:dTMP kinase [Alysiella filiformis]|uniref:Thymidylate kinase n=1 Tax=Alysiella filiformis DSM 16848 TaxID=1120981 RepID=A0A286E8V1_9NEIS|nr:dTMP kinase [Alysiella filiformis]QMT32124.1 dTMP kinase [Alysiella filiformis]UBQ56961.1 dTMP kinase [Alysiella filiformis DSM 16848]SOD67332.1 dTMP kinase [Alysiella filiformis DSM 16848]